MARTRIRWTKKVKTRLRGAIPLPWRFRAEAARVMETAEYLRLPLRAVERRWAEKRYRCVMGRKPDLNAPSAFTGEPQFVQVHAGRFSDHVCTIYDCDFNRLDVETRRPTGDFDRPDNLETLLEVASALSERLDYIRVDLYSVDERVHVGEMTPYDAGGLKQLVLASFDLEWGGLWTLPTLDAGELPVGLSLDHRRTR